MNPHTALVSSWGSNKQQYVKEHVTQCNREAHWWVMMSSIRHIRLWIHKRYLQRKGLYRNWEIWLTFAVQDLSQCSEQEQRSIFPPNSLLSFLLLGLFGLLLPLVHLGNSFPQRSVFPHPPQPLSQRCVWNYNDNTRSLRSVGWTGQQYLFWGKVIGLLKSKGIYDVDTPDYPSPRRLWGCCSTPCWTVDDMSIGVFKKKKKTKFLTF